jgi:hypothetical protein
MYHPIWEENFKDIFQIVDGRFEIDSKDLAGRKQLAMHLNDNLFKNIDRFSV